MNLLTPWSLLWFAPLAAAIVFLYLLKLRRLPRVVSSVMLWRKVVADLQANAPFQRLRRNLLLYLQLLALLAIVGALARPFVRVKALEGQSIVVILDTSGSMKATDVSGTRFGAARQIALKAVDDLGRGDAMAVIAASAETHVLSPFTSDRRALARAIRSAECTDTGTRLGEAVRLADSLCVRRKDAQIVVLSDGAAPPLGEPLASPAKLTFVRVGRRGSNVAITSLGARRPPAGGDHEILVATENLSPETRRFVIELKHEGQLVDAREQSLAAGGRRAEVFRVPQAAAGLITASLDARDDLASDNSASLFLAPRREISVLLITKGDLFLERALALDPGLAVTKAKAAPEESRSYDIAIVEGVAAPQLPRARGYLFINAAGQQAPVEVEGEVANPTVTDVARRHPVTRYLDLSGVQIGKARAALLKSWGRSLAEAGETPLIAAGERGGVRSVYVGWDLLQSDFPLRVAFPIFVANCVDWLAPAAAPGEGGAVRAGEVVSLSVPADLSEVRLVGPTGGAADLRVDQSPLLIKDTRSAGIYTVEGEKFRRQFAVNVLSREESNTKPADRIMVGGEGVGKAPGPVRTNKELWRWLVIAALCLVTLEWIAYHRRP